MGPAGGRQAADPVGRRGQPPPISIFQSGVFLLELSLRDSYKRQDGPLIEMMME